MSAQAAERRQHTTAPQEEAPSAVPAYRAFATVVARIQRLSPHFTRVTLQAEDLRHFGTHGLDQRIKLFLPCQDGSVPEVGLFDEPRQGMPHWYATWRELPEESRNPIRTYTVRHVRPDQREVDVDFVVHGTEGPASAWVVHAQPGDELIVIGPDGRSPDCGSGIEFKPGSAKDLLLVGDETAAPAICAIVESLPADCTGHAFIEVPTAEDALRVETRSSLEVHWLPRGEAGLGEVLRPEVEAWGSRRAEVLAAREDLRARNGGSVPTTTGELPQLDEDGVLWEVAEPTEHREYAWLAGEAGVITGLRRHLVKELGMSRRQVSFMGYWRTGRAGA